MTAFDQIALEVLASIPFTFGFRPRESVVVTTVHREPGQLTIGASARLDLAAFDHAGAVPAVDHALAGLARTGAVSALVTVHTDRETGSWLLDVVDLVNSRWPFPGHGGYHVHSGGHIHAFSPEGDARGHCDELELLTTHFSMSQPARSFVAGPDDFRIRRTPDGVRAERLAERLASLPDPRAVRDGHWAAATATWWESLDRGQVRGVDARALLLHALDHIPFRDGALVGALAGQAGRSPDLTCVDIASLDDSLPPDRDRLERVHAVLADVARYAPPGRAVSPLAMCAYLAWWAGDGARARILCEQADEEDPDNSLAGLVGDALDGACPPPWFTSGVREALNRTLRG